ncbi:MAG TPA: hypothetical protein VHC01_15535 [Gaiellaceae bacterium]|nr:hypothetical protein [Gaiellaceae bacterium]
MRRLLLGLFLAHAFLALCVPGIASASTTRVSAFYYPWYGTAAADGAYLHWGQDGHSPPNDIASSYYPAIGLYSSSSRVVIGQQMDEIRGAGIDEIAVSWWGRGSVEDGRLAAVAAAARADGIAVAVHIEPYGDRTVASIVADVAYLEKTYAIRTFYVYRALDLPIADWAAAHDALHAVPGTTLFAQTALAGAASAARFDGIYTYDIVTYGANTFRRICDEAHAKHLLCAPSVGPGYDARRGDGDPKLKPRRNGKTYDSMWNMALKSGADLVTITSFNEWHEGTQIEPAALPGRHGRYRYLSYNGAWGLNGVRAEFAYLNRTRYWADRFKKTAPVAPSTSPS